MAYNNGGGMNRNSYGSNNQRNNGYAQRSKPAYQKSNVRHSDCKEREITNKKNEKKLCWFGWKYTKKDGLVSFVATDADAKYQKYPTESIAMVVKVTSKFGERLVWGSINKKTNVMLIKSLNMVASCNGRYWSNLMPKNLKR
jgi:hypothetical protein